MKKPPYPWKSVLFWTFLFFVLGYITALPPEGFGSGQGAVVFKLFIAIVYALLAAIIVGIYRYFRRPQSVSANTTPAAASISQAGTATIPTQPDPQPQPKPKPFAGFQDIPEQPRKPQEDSLQLPKGQE